MPNEPTTTAEQDIPQLADCNAFIVGRLMEKLGGMSFRQIGRTTEFNAETVRRYMNGSSRISADFIHQVCRKFDLDANVVLMGQQTPLKECDLKRVRTDLLWEELGRRVMRIEDCAVGRIVAAEDGFS